MRKLKLQVQTTIDGYMGGPNGEMDWMAGPWSDDMSAYVDALYDGVDCILLGRKLAEGFIPAWESGPPGEDQASIDTMNNTPKVVISNSLGESPWKNATVEGGDLGETVTRLKAGTGGDLITFGGATLAAGLIERGLVDDLYLFVNPASIGKGLPVFPPGATQAFRLAEARPFECGIIGMHYQPQR